MSESRSDLVAANEELRARVAAQEREIELLKAKITALEHRVGRSSKNSSLPPSADSIKDKAEATKDRAARRAAAKAARKEDLTRKRGKQPGAPGVTLKKRDDPTSVIDHEPECCSSCGADLATAPVEGIEVRQVFDTPVPLPLECIEHRVATKRCSCGATTKASFPPEARSTTCYGPGVRAVALYLLHRQHLPVERTAETLSSLFGAPVSTGFVASLATEAAEALDASGVIAEICRRLRGADLVHADETSDQVGTKTWWFHVVTNDLFTYLFASPTRGKDAPDQAGVLGDFTGTMVHDRLAMYFNYDQATHAICLAHIARELAAVGIVWNQGWANDMADLLSEMNAAGNAARDKGRTRLGHPVVKDFLARYDRIVEDGLAANPARLGRKRDSVERASFNLVSALRDLRAEATRFVTDLSVPMTNNAAERALRMAKLHRKISGCFQSDAGARSFATIRSYIATAAKHDVDVFRVLAGIFRGEVWMPPAVT